MPEFPEEASSNPVISGGEQILAVRLSDGVMIYVTPNQLKTFVGSGLPSGFFDSASKIQPGFLPAINLMPLFDQSQFALVGGKISYLGGGTGTPATPLTAPVLSLYGNSTDTQIGVQWAAITHATGYDIYRTISGAQVKVGTTTSLNYTNTGLTANTQYTHYVKAITNASGYSDSAFSNPLTASTTVASGLPTPIAPTVVFDAAARTLKFTHTAYPNGIEYRTNSGAWGGYVAGTAIAVGDNAVSANYYECRVKAVAGGNNVGVPAGNTYIAAANSGAIPAGFSPVTLLGDNVNVDISSNTFTWLGTDPYGAGVSQVKIPAGQPFEIRFDGSLSIGSGWIAVDTGTNIEGVNSFLAGIKWMKSSDSSAARFVGISQGQGQDDYTNRDYVGTPKGSIIGDGTSLRIRRNINGDNGVTWEEIDSSVVIAQPNADMYIKMFFDDVNSTSVNLIGKGLI